MTGLPPMTAVNTAPDHAETSGQIGRKGLGGPKTPEGEARSRTNAIKHGMTASLPVLPGEDPDAFKRRVEDFIDALRPTNAVELALTEQAALATWKIARGERAAAARAAAALRAAEATAGLAGQDHGAPWGHWPTPYRPRSRPQASRARFPL